MSLKKKDSVQGGIVINVKFREGEVVSRDFLRDI